MKLEATPPPLRMSVLRLEIGGQHRTGHMTNGSHDRRKKLAIRSYNSKTPTRALDVGPFTVPT